MEHPYESTNSSLYSLHIRICSAGFTFSVFDESNSILSIKKVTALIASLSLNDIIDIIKRETQLYYRNINLIYESDIYTIIPESIFMSENAGDLLYLQHKPETNDLILYNVIHNLGIVIAFAISGSVQKALSQIFPHTAIEHHLSFVLTDKIKQQNENGIYIWVRSKTLDVIAFKNSKLHLVNSFGYLTPEDFTYFTLNIFEQLSLDIEKCKVD